VINFEALEFAAAGAEFLADGVAGDLFDPGGEIACGIELMEMAVNGDERLLHQVFGLGIVQQHSSDDTPDVLLVVADDLAEAVEIASQDAAEDRLELRVIHGFSNSMPPKTISNAEVKETGSGQSLCEFFAQGKNFQKVAA